MPTEDPRNQPFIFTKADPISQYPPLSSNQGAPPRYSPPKHAGVKLEFEEGDTEYITTLKGVILEMMTERNDYHRQLFDLGKVQS